MNRSTSSPAAFGRYRVVRRIGAGGMGAVYLARDEALGREVAVKVLRPLGPVGEPPPAEMVERFQREAQAVALLSHPSVVRVYDQGVDGEGLPYLVMELVDGPTLAERLEQEGPLPLREVRTLGIQIASALGAAHAVGIVHRDVKPSNVLCDRARDHLWKLADFGIAHTPDSSLTITGQFLGTPSFAAPEALEGGASSPAADVYSLAATLYAALAGEPPYGDAGLAQLVVAMAQGHTPAALASRRADVPAGIAGAIDRGLALAPDQRPAAAELAHHLALDQGAAGAAPPDPPGARSPAPRGPSPTVSQQVPATGTSPGRRTWLLLAGALLAALVLGIVIGGGGGRDGGAGAGSGGLGPLSGPAQKLAPGGAGEDDDVPPWEVSGPPEALRRGGPPSDIDKHWRKAYDKLVEGDWDKGEHELREVLARDPGDPTAAAWLDWLDRAQDSGRAGWTGGGGPPHGHGHGHERKDRDEQWQGED